MYLILKSKVVQILHETRCYWSRAWAQPYSALLSAFAGLGMTLVPIRNSLARALVNNIKLVLVSERDILHLCVFAPLHLCIVASRRQE